MIPIVVRQGEYWTDLAFRLSFDPDAVWSDPQNADIRAKRADREMLWPGDVVYVPEHKPAYTPLTVGAVNVLVFDVPHVTSKVRFLDADGEACKGAACEIDPPLGGSATYTTDGDGVLTLDVPVTVHEVTIRVAGLPDAYALRVGHLDPIEEASGLCARLAHLGFPVDDGADDDHGLAQNGASLAAALESFRVGYAIAPDADVVAMLKSIHGS